MSKVSALKGPLLLNQNTVNNPIFRGPDKLQKLHALGYYAAVGKNKTTK